MTELVNNIRYLTRREIDPEKWDTCIMQAANGLIYARSFYLDAMAKNWAALVMNDYEAVMPLPWNKKYGFSYLYQPAFTPQLGIFATRCARQNLFASGGTISSVVAEAFLAVLRGHFRFAEICLNYGNTGMSMEPHPNFILHLDASYEQLSSRYKKDLKKNLKVAQRSFFQYTKDVDLQSTLALYQHLYQDQIPHMKNDVFDRFKSLCLFLQHHGQILLRGVRDSKQEILATALLPRDRGRIYLLESSVTAAGRHTCANHFLLDNLIREFSGQPMILDFEGSALPGVAHFYKNFGAENQPYFFYRHNNLPWPIRMVK